MILAGKTLTNMYDRYGNEQKKKVNTIIEFISIIVEDGNKYIKGKTIPSEKLEGLIQLVKSDDFSKIRQRVIDEVGESGVCSEGVIDIINSQIFEGNDFQTYFVLTNLLHSGKEGIKLGNDDFIYKQMKKNIEDTFIPVNKLTEHFAILSQTKTGIDEENRIK